MARAREGHGATIAVPPPVPLERVRRAWDDVPELACAESWQRACRAWWDDPADSRLRAMSLDALWVGDAELDEWLKRRFDGPSLIRAHGHVTATRAGVERDLSGRTLETGELRAVPVWTDHHDGTRRMFAAPEDVPKLLDRAYADFRSLPDHAFIRAAWLSQMLGVVHPFRDANGGTARFFVSLELVRRSLPPFILSVELRNGAYIEAIAYRENLDPLAVVVYEAVQQRLANTLLSGRAPGAAWDAASHERGQSWLRLADEALRGAAGASLGIERDDPSGSALATLARAGYRVALSPLPLLATWRLATAVPARFDVAIMRLQGGPIGWTCVVLSARAGEDGELGAVLDREHVAHCFVTPDGEPEDVVNGRFRHWLASRVEQSMRGLARWM